MLARSGNHLRILCALTALLAAPLSPALAPASWSGALTDGAGKPVGQAIVKLHAASGSRDYTAATVSDGKFAFAEIVPGAYEVSAATTDKTWKSATSIVFKEGDMLTLRFRDYPKQAPVVLHRATLALLKPTAA